MVEENLKSELPTAQDCLAVQTRIVRDNIDAPWRASELSTISPSSGLMILGCLIVAALSIAPPQLRN